MTSRPFVLLAVVSVASTPANLSAQCTTVPFVESARISVPSAGAEFLVAADVNGDGKPDLLMKSSTYFIQAALGTGAGQFTALPTRTDVGDAASAAVADFDGDGILDLVTGGTNSVKLLRGVGNGQFALRRATNLTPLGNLGTPPRTATSVIVGDFNGDRKLDIAFPVFSNAHVRIQLSDAQGMGVAAEQSLAPAGFGPIPTGIKPYHLAAVDFNNDGELDLAMTDAGGSSVALVTQYDPNPAGYTSLGSIQIGPQPFSLAKGDFNNDGFTDLAVKDADGKIVLMKGGVRNNFSQLLLEKWTTTQPPISPGYLVAGDFNNDGRDDLLVTGSSIQLLLGDGAGNFTTLTVAQLGGWPTAAAISDFDRDGRLDFAVVNKADNYVAVFLNRCAGPPADLAIAGMEVTQTIQDFGNTVPLIAGKRTFVRVHVRGNVQARGISARLSATDAAGVALSPVLLPQNPSGLIDVKTSPDRGAIDDSFWFELPVDWLSRPALVLKAEVNTNQALSEADYTNDVMTRTVTMSPGKILKVRLVRYRHPDVEMSDEFFDRSANEAAKDLLIELPVAALDVARREFVDSDPTIGTSPHSVEIAHLQAWQNIFEPNSPGVFYYGIGGFIGGVARRGTLDVANWFGVGTTAVIVHEFGHMLSLGHVNGTGGTCGTPDGVDPAYPYPEGRIGGVASEPGRFFGVNPINPQPAFANLFEVVPNTIWDTMSYCRPQWFADWSVNRMLAYMQQNPNIAMLSEPPARRAPEMARSVFALANREMDRYETERLAPPDPYTVGDFLTVYGIVDLAQQTVTSVRVSREPSVGTVAVSQPGASRVRLIGAAGQTLATHAFTPERLADAGNAGLIALTLPYSAGTRTIVIETGTPSRALRTINVSQSAPTVTAVAVTQRTTAPKRTSITWRGADADGDALSYTVLYSTDGKLTWRPIAKGIRVNRYIADSAALEGTGGNTSGHIAVVAHDGVLTARAVSAPFRVENKAPRVLLVAPQAEAVYEATQLVTLQAMGDDPEDGALADAALTWKSDRDGPLGNGRLAQARNLSKGDHLITVTATDSDGRTARRSSLIHVGNRPLPLVVSCIRGTGARMALGGRTPSGAVWALRSEAVRGMIKSGRAVYTTDAAGRVARLRVVRRGATEYLRSVTTDERTDNLLELPACQ